MKSNLLFHIISLIFPARCPICNKIVQRQSFLCPDCIRDVERIADQCHGCGCPKNACLCGRNGFHLQLTAPFAYKGNIRSAIHRFKFRDERELAQYFGEEIVKTVKRDFSQVDFDLVTCVPQTKKRRRERGYNQSALLAKSIAASLNLKLEENLLIKTRETANQHELKGKSRLTNLKGAFSVSETAEIKGKIILLCDDIKTTGATLNECRKTLLKSGVKDVYCAAIAVVPDKIQGE